MGTLSPKWKGLDGALGNAKGRAWCPGLILSLIQRALYPRPEGRGFTARWVTIEKCSQEFNERNFAPVEYTDAKGEKRPMYLLSKDGFMMVAMAYITPEAMRIKEAYIARFNEMEEQLRTTSPLLPNFRDPIAAAEAWIVAKDVCECLEIGNSRDAVASLDDDEKGVSIIDTPGGKHKRNPRSLTGSGALRYQKVASSTDSVSAGASYLRKPQLTRRQYHVTGECQAF